MFASALHRRWRSLLPPLFALWTALLAAGCISMMPALDSLKTADDRAIFEPGALMLLETLRLHRTDVFESLKLSLLLSLGTSAVVLFFRARLTAVVVDVDLERLVRKSWFDRSLSYAGVSLLKVGALAVLLALTALALRALPGFEGALAPRVLAVHLLFLLAAASSLAFIVIIFDLTRLSLFHELALGERLATAAEALRADWKRLLAATLVRWFGLLATGAITLQISVRPISSEPWNAALTFVVTQALVIIALLMELWWLLLAERSLADALERESAADHSAAACAEAAPR